MIRPVWPDGQVPPHVPRCCPFCCCCDHGVTEPQLWAHLVACHDAIDQVAAAVVEVDEIRRRFDAARRRAA